MSFDSRWMITMRRDDDNDDEVSPLLLTVSITPARKFNLF